MQPASLLKGVQPPPRSLACRVCGDPELTRVGTVEGFEFVECAGCGFTFAPRITREWLEQLYSSGYHGPEDGAPSIGWADWAFLQPALRLLPDRPLRILDFGTGQSQIPGILRGMGHRVVAVDLAPPLESHPDRLTGCLLSLELDSAQFDLIYAFQVFEHLPEPVPFVMELLRLSSPGGLVLIHTDMEMPEREQDFTGWWYVLPPDHCAFYRHRTFEVMLRGSPHRIAWKDPKCVILQAGPRPE